MNIIKIYVRYFLANPSFDSNTVEISIETFIDFNKIHTCAHFKVSINYKHKN